MKPFTTHRQQLRILRDRGLTISDGSRAMRILERENYYGLINGYKDLFLRTNQNGTTLTPEQYKTGSTFEEIYYLYSFDRELRGILLNELLKFESSIKSKISYRFSEKYKESHAYLVMKNYSRDSQKLKDVLNVITTISRIISDQGKKKNKNSIKHYLDKHDGVPLWVLVNYLTIGNIQYFYYCLDTSLQNQIAKDFAEAFRKDYGTSIQFTPDMIQNILKTANYFRNVCAHEERLYSFKIHKPSRSADISQVINIPITKLDKGNVFTIVSFLKLVLSKREHKVLIRNIKNLFTDYEADFTSVNFTDISATMGFDPNWENYF